MFEAFKDENITLHEVIKLYVLKNYFIFKSK